MGVHCQNAVGCQNETVEGSNKLWELNSMEKLNHWQYLTLAVFLRKVPIYVSYIHMYLHNF